MERERREREERRKKGREREKGRKEKPWCSGLRLTVG
jgi:hypothetical protein